MSSLEIQKLQLNLKSDIPLKHSLTITVHI